MALDMVEGSQGINGVGEAAGKKRSRQAKAKAKTPGGAEPSGAESAPGEVMAASPRRKGRGLGKTAVQRCRFVELKPKAVLAMASDAAGSRVAVARRMGAIEVWQLAPSGRMLQSLMCPGQQETSEMSNAVLCLSWSAGRLFAGDVDGNVFEMDLAEEARVNETSAFGGAVWCMDAQRHGPKHLAVGCEDGRVRLFEPLGEGSADGLEYVKALRSAGGEGRLLALRWHPAEKHASVLFTGGIDGKIRRWDVEQGSVTLTITAESYGRQGPLCVWSLAVLSDSTVFSGDSEGHIHAWRTEDDSGTLINSFHEHRADVLALAVSGDEQTVFGSGMDSRVAQFRLLPADEDQGVPARWVYAYSHRPHTHDVRGLVVVDGGKTLVSAGNDTQLCWYPTQGFSKARPRRVLPFLQRQLVHTSEDGGRLLVRHDFHLEVYVPSTQQLLAKLRFNGRHGLRCSTLSRDGSLVAAGDDLGLKVFRVRGGSARSAKRRKTDEPHPDESDKASGEDEDEGEEDLGLHRFDFRKGLDPTSRGSAPVACCFSWSGSLLACALQSGEILLFKMPTKRDGKIALMTSFSQLAGRRSGERSAASGAIQRLELSRDEQWLAVGDDSGTVSVLSVDTQQQRCEISRAMLSGDKYTSFAFQPLVDETRLVLTTAQNRFFVFDVDQNQLAPWSQQVAERSDKRLAEIVDSMIGVSFSPRQPQTAIFWGRSFAFKVRLDRIAAEAEDAGPLKFHLLQRYRSILHLEATGKDEMLVLETPWLRIMENFQAPVARKKYGAA